MRLALVVAFRESSWRRPLREPTVLEVWNTERTELIATFPAALLEGLIRTHLDMAEQQARLNAVLHPPPAPDPPAPAPVADVAEPDGPPAELAPRLAAPPQRRLRGLHGRRLRGFAP